MSSQLLTFLGIRSHDLSRCSNSRLQGKHNPFQSGAHSAPPILWSPNRPWLRHFPPTVSSFLEATPATFPIPEAQSRGTATNVPLVLVGQGQAGKHTLRLLYGSEVGSPPPPPAWTVTSAWGTAASRHWR